MQDNFIEKVRTLYCQGHSLPEVANELHCSPHKVVYWMDRAGIQRRKPSEALYRKYNPNGDPFSIQEAKTPTDAKLFGLGIGIYWGEGDKRSPHGARVANGDPELIRTFVQFLTKICGFQKNKIKYSIVCFNDSNIADVGSFWSNFLQIPIENFGKIVQIPQQGKGKYKKKSKNGVCTVAVYNTKFKQWIMQEIKRAYLPR